MLPSAGGKCSSVISSPLLPSTNGLSQGLGDSVRNPSHGGGRAGESPDVKVSCWLQRSAGNLQVLNQHQIWPSPDRSWASPPGQNDTSAARSFFGSGRSSPPQITFCACSVNSPTMLCVRGPWDGRLKGWSFLAGQADGRSPITPGDGCKIQQPTAVSAWADPGWETWLGNPI